MLPTEILNNVLFDILNSKWAELQINTYRHYVTEMHLVYKYGADLGGEKKKETWKER